jgi:hypothetical protein
MRVVNLLLEHLLEPFVLGLEFLLDGGHFDVETKQLFLGSLSLMTQLALPATILQN